MKTKYLLLLYLFSFAAVLACCSLFTCNNRNGIDLAGLSKNSSHLLQQADENTRKQLTVLQGQAEQLQKQLRETQSALSAVNKKHVSVKASLQRAIRQQQEIKASRDTVKLLSHCDTLATASLVYIQTAEEKDSLQEMLQYNLQAQVQQRDTMLRLQQERYDRLQLRWENSQWLARQQQRTIRRQRISGGLKNIGLLVLGGLLLKGQF